MLPDKQINQVTQPEQLVDFRSFTAYLENLYEVWYIRFVNRLYPVGQILYNGTDSRNPSVYLGVGTWEAEGTGRVLVGISSSDTEFDTIGETGGAKTHTLTTAEIPSHSHSWLSGSGGAAGGGNAYARNDAGYNVSAPTSSAGGGGSHNNLQPYKVVYCWRRTA